jgi:hypothetical protein
VALRPPGTSSPTFWLAPPDPASYPARILSGTTPIAQIKAEIEQSLPIWARPAGVRVWEISGERRVEVVVPLSAAQLLAVDASDVVPAILHQQIRLNAGGAGIAGVFVRLEDLQSGTPLFTYAGDYAFGQNFYWASPVVAAWFDKVPSDSGHDEATQAKADLESALESAGGPITSQVPTDGGASNEPGPAGFPSSGCLEVAGGDPIDLANRDFGQAHLWIATRRPNAQEVHICTRIETSSATFGARIELAANAAVGESPIQVSSDTSKCEFTIFRDGDNLEVSRSGVGGSTATICVSSPRAGAAQAFTASSQGSLVPPSVDIKLDPDSLAAGI